MIWKGPTSVGPKNSGVSPYRSAEGLSGARSAERSELPFLWHYRPIRRRQLRRYGCGFTPAFGRAEHFYDASLSAQLKLGPCAHPAGVSVSTVASTARNTLHLRRCLQLAFFSVIQVRALLKYPFSSLRGTTASRKPCASRNSARWKPSGSF